MVQKKKKSFLAFSIFFSPEGQYLRWVENAHMKKEQEEEEEEKMDHVLSFSPLSLSSYLLCVSEREMGWSN